RGLDVTGTALRVHVAARLVDLDRAVARREPQGSERAVRDEVAAAGGGGEAGPERDRGHEVDLGGELEVRRALVQAQRLADELGVRSVRAVLDLQLVAR